MEQRLLAKRYQELHAIADAALKMSERIISVTKNNNGNIFNELSTSQAASLNDMCFSLSQCNIIAIDYSVSSLEAFINQVGYLIVDGWKENHEKKNFLGQYEKIVARLCKLGISMPQDMKNSPYGDFEAHRKLRNSIHHIHSSNDDFCTVSGTLETESMISLLSNWPQKNNGQAAKSAYENTKKFIINFHTRIQEDSDAIKESINNEDSKDFDPELFDYFVRNPPFCPSIVVGTAVIENQSF